MLLKQTDGGLAPRDAAVVLLLIVLALATGWLLRRGSEPPAGPAVILCSAAEAEKEELIRVRGDLLSCRDELDRLRDRYDVQDD